VRIALITETFLPDVNGVVTTLCRLLEHLQRRNHAALLFAPYDAPESYAGAEVVRLRGWPLPLYPGLKLTPPQPRIFEGLRRFRPDIVHLAGPVMLGPAAVAAGMRVGAPLLGVYHTDWPAYASYYGLGTLRSLAYAYLRRVHNACAATLCPSSATLADLRAHGFRRLRVWGRGVDTDRFHPARRSAVWRASVGARPGERLILYAGRLAAEKRLDLLAVLASLPATRLVIVGDGPARAGLERELAGAPATFTGFLQGDDLATAYASADLFVFPSATETFGQVIQEAMASGLPVVAARAGGALDLIREGETGLFFAPGSPADLRAAARELLDAPERRAAMGRAARAAAERRTWSHVLDALLEHYTRVIRPHVRARARARLVGAVGR
jgi:glycosyltransferase involved in cell wall biosynthesis